MKNIWKDKLTCYVIVTNYYSFEEGCGRKRDLIRREKLFLNFFKNRTKPHSVPLQKQEEVST